MAITTAMTLSFKTELLQATHCFNATVTPTGSTASGSTSVTAVSSMTGVSVGMGITGTGIAASFIAAIPSTTTLTIVPAATATNSGVTLTISPDVFKLALVKAGMAGTYGATTTNYSAVTGNSDEVPNGSGYTTGGVTLGNVTPTNDGISVAWTTFSPNPSWTTATFSTAGCMIYNSSVRNAGVSNRAVSVHDFGGVQSVSSGTLTILIPSPNAGSALLRLS